MSSGFKPGEWTGCLHFYDPDQGWIQFKHSHHASDYFEDELDAEKEIITHAEIRMYTLSGWITKIPFLNELASHCGYWHEYTLIKTTNWHWSFEKTAEGIFVQRSKDRDGVRLYNATSKRPNEDRTEGRSSNVFFGENIFNAIDWIRNKNELGCKYHFWHANCHHFASLLYEAITRTCKGRRLNNTV